MTNPSDIPVAISNRIRTVLRSTINLELFRPLLGSIYTIFDFASMSKSNKSRFAEAICENYGIGAYWFRIAYLWRWKAKKIGVEVDELAEGSSSCTLAPTGQHLSLSSLG